MEAALQDAHKAVAQACAGLMASSTRKPTIRPMRMHSRAASTLVTELFRLLWESFFLSMCYFALLSLLACTCHIQAQFLHGGGLGVKFAHDLALVHHQDAVGQVHHLVQLQADQQHGLALVALGHDLLVDILNGADVQAAGGLHCHQQLGSLSISRAMMAFCWLPPDMLRTMVTALTAAHIVLLDQLVGISRTSPADKACPLELRLPVALQHHVVFQL